VLRPERLRADLLRTAELYSPSKGCKALDVINLKVTTSAGAGKFLFIFLAAHLIGKQMQYVLESIVSSAVGSPSCMAL
jgi:hypothetical protein